MRVVFGTLACLGMLNPGSGPWRWSITYHDQVVTVHDTLDPKLCDEFRPSHRFTYSVCDGATCTAPTSETCIYPLPGDADCNGAVGASDFLLVREHFGEVKP